MFSSYAYGDISSVNNFLSYIGVGTPSEWLEGHKYIYFTFETYDDWNQRNQTNGVYFSLTDQAYNTGNYYIEYQNNILLFRCPNAQSTQDCTCVTDSNANSFSRNFYGIYFNFNDNTFRAAYYDSSNAYLDSNNEVYSGTFTDFETNLSEYAPQTLSLSFSFRPSMSGAVSRSETINGKEYTSNTLDVYVTNNGSDAQWLLAILPSGDNLTFPESTLENNQGFLGSPTFVYVTDEFSTFNIANGQTSIYAGCAWRAIPSGYSNQPYHILWSSIDLKANTSYDLVCYGALNPDSIITNAASGGGFNMRGNFSVTSDLSTVEEVYRSTFTISDPAVFDPNIIDEAGTGHAWNPNADNSHLFTNAAAYRDDNGNLIIRGFSNGGVDYTAWSDTIPDTSLTQATTNVFSFVASFFKLLPASWGAMIFMGISAIVVVAIIKKGTS